MGVCAHLGVSLVSLSLPSLFPSLSLPISVRVCVRVRGDTCALFTEEHFLAHKPFFCSASPMPLCGWCGRMSIVFLAFPVWVCEDLDEVLDE